LAHSISEVFEALHIILIFTGRELSVLKWFFYPTGSNHCTDSGQIWQGAADAVPNLSPIGPLWGFPIAKSPKSLIFAICLPQGGIPLTDIFEIYGVYVPL